MAFHDVQLPTDIERGAQGGPRFKTTVMTLSSGLEKRNVEWRRTRGEWDIGYGIQAKEDLQAVIDFFYARQGRAHSFRFKDWSDYEVGDAATNTPAAFAAGDSTTVAFQLEKRYTSGGYTFHRPITKPRSSTVRIFVNSVEQFGNWSVNALTGIVTFNSAPANLAAIQAILEFDVPVRFDTDAMDINMEMFAAGSFPQLPVVEVKNE